MALALAQREMSTNKVVVRSGSSVRGHCHVLGHADAVSECHHILQLLTLVIVVPVARNPVFNDLKGWLLANPLVSSTVTSHEDSDSLCSQALSLVRISPSLQGWKSRVGTTCTGRTG